MFSMLPTLYTHNNPSHYYTPAIPSPLSSSPLRSCPSPLSDRDTNVPSSPSPERDGDSLMSSPLKGFNTSIFGDTIIGELGASGKGSEGNAMLPRQDSNRPQQSTMITPPQNNRHDSVYSKRTTKSNPLMHSSRPSSNEGRETRRKLFLKKVRDVADEKRWKSRGLGGNGGMGGGEEEEIMRCIWMQEERKTEERRRREALGVQLGEEVEEDIVDEREQEVEINLDEMMADEVARDEEREVEEYLKRIPTSESYARTDSQEHEANTLLFGTGSSYHVPTISNTDSLYGSDDDEYDEIFMDVIEEEERISSSQHQQPSQRQSTPAYVDDEEMMDLS